MRSITSPWPHSCCSPRRLFLGLPTGRWAEQRSCRGRFTWAGVSETSPSSPAHRGHRRAASLRTVRPGSAFIRRRTLPPADIVIELTFHRKLPAQRGCRRGWTRGSRNRQDYPYDSWIRRQGWMTQSAVHYQLVTALTTKNVLRE